MQDSTPPPLWAVLGNTLVLVLSIAVLSFVFVVIPVDCACVGGLSGKSGLFGPGPGAYLAEAVFLVLGLYAAFSLFRLLFAAKAAACPVCSIISKK